MRTPDLNPADFPSSDFIASDELAAQLRRPLAWRKRVAQIGLSLLALAALIALIVHPTLVSQPTPTLPIVAHIRLHSLVNYGTLQINGKTQSFLPHGIIGLHAGLNTIALTAPPFHRVSCVIDIPTRVHDTCLPYNTTGSGNSEVIIPVSLHDLPANLGQSALQTLQQTFLDAAQQLQTTVMPGESFISGFDPNTHAVTTQVTHAPLTATLVIQSVLDCVLMPSSPQCAWDDVTYADNQAPAWGMYLPITFYWRFNDAQGRNVANLSATAQHTVALISLHYAAGWQLMVSQLAGSTSTLVTPNPLSTYLAGQACDVSIFGLFNGGQTSLKIAPNSNSYMHASIEGCEAMVPVIGAMGTTSAHLITRFGVVYAADSFTAQLSSALPIATPQQLALIESQG